VKALVKMREDVRKGLFSRHIEEQSDSRLCKREDGKAGLRETYQLGCIEDEKEKKNVGDVTTSKFISVSAQSA
jgi:hypothetical protein